jgi:hypothetical protein
VDTVTVTETAKIERRVALIAIPSEEEDEGEVGEREGD